MADRLAGRIAVVTGAANGIGAGCAAVFAAEGAQVIAIDRADADLTDEAQVNALFARIGAEHGHV